MGLLHPGQTSLAEWAAGKKSSGGKGRSETIVGQESGSVPGIDDSTDGTSKAEAPPRGSDVIEIQHGIDHVIHQDHVLA